MLAVRNALLAFRDQLTDRYDSTKLMSDNASVVSYLRKQGGTVSVPLYLLAREVLLLARDAQITLRAKHIPGERNALADLLWSHRVDSTPIGGGFTVHHMGQTQCGPVCHPDEQQVTRVCIPHGRSIGVGCRRHVNLMERDVCLRISPVRYAGAGTREGTERAPLRDDLNRPQMAQSVLVGQTDGVAGHLFFGPSPERRPADPTPQPPQTAVTPNRLPSRLEAVQRSLQERGFSQAAAEQISQGRRQSSRAVYDSKWRIFVGWCAEKSLDPFQVTIPQLADFFVYLNSK